MNLKKLKSLFINNGCDEIYIKKLSPNDNSKNQVYFGGNFEILNILPISGITTVGAGDWSRERFKASLNFSWITDTGDLSPANHSQLILYPKYPEVRFSGFLLGSRNAPSELMTQRLADRLLFIGVSKSGTVLGHVVHPESEIAKEFIQEENLVESGVFFVMELPQTVNNRLLLLKELTRIYNKGWIDSKRLDSDSNILPCRASNCGGYTLEAELGITPNGYSEPDYMGWEIKQFGVQKFKNINSSVITLMTPEPTDGLYKSEGTEYFVKTYGYPDKLGRPDRMNFGGVHKAGILHPTTKLEMKLIGFDKESGKIRNSNGSISLVDQKGNEAASWSFSSMLLHWNRKHDKACYVPSLSDIKGDRKYKYGNNIILGTGTDFQLFLMQMANGNIYYDPGIKLENMSTKPKVKKRSQFRIKSRFLPNLYKKNETIDLSII
ncbi:MvaI/BcnI family restriction endonuclease [Leeuwenhoekiella sp. MAR_2009_132]|uniref:MvaI/BcnI family restriction endonuclease n=1 Tax=Leeuwenhoekiella sp. MAR_2009_132 TaxID=1392489 RepID=UPI00048F4AD5|nr:MvaI/BcnI family restriction endonuclease [Leeuwenhoekiella sp. MAR_2009_132]